LIALRAEITVYGPKGSRTMTLEELFHLPREDSRRLTILEPGEIITSIHLPPPVKESAGVYLKAMERKVWSFAQASVAMQMSFEGREIKDASVVLGGVAPIPWSLPDLDADLIGEQIFTILTLGASDMAVLGAQPLSKNSYKIDLVKGLVAEALTRLADRQGDVKN